jgi:hypothetical protein
MSVKSRIPRSTYKGLMRRSKGRCEWCKSDEECGIDHIIPRSRGGTNNRKNLQVLCRRCGCWKGSDLPQRVISRIRRMKVRCNWAKAVKSTGLQKMIEFIKRMEQEKMGASDETPTGFPPVAVSIGEGKTACQVAMVHDGVGIVFQVLNESHDVGSLGGSIIGNELKANQVFVVCRNRRGAEILQALATQVIDLMDATAMQQSDSDNSGEPDADT